MFILQDTRNTSEPEKSSLFRLWTIENDLHFDVLTEKKRSPQNTGEGGVNIKSTHSYLRATASGANNGDSFALERHRLVVACGFEPRALELVLETRKIGLDGERDWPTTKYDMASCDMLVWLLHKQQRFARQ